MSRAATAKSKPKPTLTLVTPPATPQWKAPTHLMPKTRQWFTDVVKAYELEEHHCRLLTVAGEEWDAMTKARGITDRLGLTFNDRFGQPKARPEVAIARDARIGFMRALRELALDVSAPDSARPPGLAAGRRR